MFFINLLQKCEVQQTTGLINRLITQKEQKEQQLKQLDKLDEVYQAWDKSPQTSQMRSLAQVLNSPLMQERLANINQQRQQQEQLPKSALQQPHQKQHRAGLSL
ncbi:MAG: hypothetical protein KME05_22515 [Gloeocapsa sp. UFS-A4-WI-NPMV-4B04]|nr:hypothetical protein [Gloeocapsa sp. UFS-A4-WI-NPMV-4B04]